MHQRRLLLFPWLPAVLAVLAGWTQAPQRDVTFFALGDPQINIPRWGIAGTEQTIALMNVSRVP